MEWLIFGILRYLVCQLRDKQATQTTSCTLKTMQERNLCSQVIYIETILRMQVASLLPWVPEVFFLVCDGELRFVGRRTTRVRPKAELTRAETAQPGTQGTSLPITDDA